MRSKLIDTGLLRKLETLKLNSNIVLNKGYSGGRKSKSKGSSVEFSDFREYVPGDDFRKIDWNAYGRFEKLFVKLFMEEREALVNIFIDTSKSMDFGQTKKSFIAKQLALTFTYLSLSNLDRVDLYIGENNSLQNSGYLNGKKTLPRIVTYLDNLQFEEKEDFFPLIKTRQYKKGISIIISDVFTDNFEETIKYLTYMKQRVIVIQILTTEELTPKFSGDITFIDSETDQKKDISITSSVQHSYQNTLKHFIGNIEEVCNKYGAIYTLLSNEISIEEMIFDKLIAAGILRG